MAGSWYLGRTSESSPGTTLIAGRSPTVAAMVGEWLSRVRALPPRVVDAALAGALALFAVQELLVSGELPTFGSDGLGYVSALAQSGAVAVRRTDPGRAMAVAGIAGLAMGVTGAPTTFTGVFGIMVTLYSVAAHGSEEDARWSGAITAIALAIIIATLWDEFTLSDIIANYLLFGTAWALGWATRHRRLLLVELEARAVAADRARHAEAHRAVAEERGRIARELHDVVAHSVSVMVVQTGAARRLLERDPASARGALLTIEETGRSALGELRRTVTMLRGDDHEQPLAPQPTLDGLESLVGTLRETGVPVALEVSGDPQPLPAGIDVSAYRIVQEALTNVLKHAGVTKRVRVRVRFVEEAVEIEVEDDGSGAASAPAVGGHGLVGMRERVLLYAGTLEAGPLRAGGFRVRARLPLPGGGPAEAASS